MDADRKILIVGGNSRSGTTTLARLLHGHPDFAIGREQFDLGWHEKRVTRAAFSEEGMTRFDPRLSSPEARDRMAGWMSAGKYRAAKWVGDKFPRLHLAWENIDAEMPEAEVLFIVRNPLSVMESYQRRLLDPDDHWQRTALDAIREWNRGVLQAIDRIEAGKPLRVVSYEKAFASREAMSRIFATFGASISDANESNPHFGVGPMVRRFWELEREEGPRNEVLRRLAAEECAFAIYRTLVREHCILADLPLPGTPVRA